ncbi:MAG: iron-sulfur cluster assembly scaffold protein [Nanoarchaeota archaeon]|nr:iron-sulfur cluster assembly scaffold protein [Nanoarchaeota archaeon]
MYTEKVMENFRHPHNLKEIKDADGIGKIGNPTCGDVMWVFIKVGKNSEGKKIIEDIGVKTFGCVAAIASSSVTTDLVKGKTIEEAKNISKDDILKGLGDLPPVKVHCSVLAQDGLKKAIQDYEDKKKHKD